MRERILCGGLLCCQLKFVEQMSMKYKDSCQPCVFRDMRLDIFEDRQSHSYLTVLNVLEINSSHVYVDKLESGFLN